MSRTDTSAWPCTIARTADLLGDEWDLLIVRQACLGARRFEDFRAGLGIGRNVLTNHLNRLVALGVLSREPYQERPLRHHYRLTDKGRDVFPILAAMASFGEKWLSGPEGAPITLHHTACGHDMRPETVCDHCGTAIHVRETQVRPGPGHPSSSDGASSAGRRGR
ncbi:MAG TPA: helix-turn-helix domain-containing protein [Acidimicrobiales bacterium]|nr:helix-turn-helix domain-containing protein [Acidimicrobiales bacterium]